MGKAPDPDEQPEEDAFLELCVDDANDWCFEARRIGGYVDNPVVAPNTSVLAAATLYAKRAYLLGVDGDAPAFSEFGGGVPGVIPTMDEIQRKLRNRTVGAA